MIKRMALVSALSCQNCGLGYFILFVIRSIPPLIAECSPDNGMCCVMVLQQLVYICIFQPDMSNFNKQMLTYTQLSWTINELQIPSNLSSLVIRPRSILVSGDCKSCSLGLDLIPSISMAEFLSHVNGFVVQTYKTIQFLIVLQHERKDGREKNWLPAFILMLSSTYDELQIHRPV